MKRRRLRGRAPDLSQYGWPPEPRHSSARTDTIASLLVLAAVLVVVFDPRSNVPTWSEYPDWWVPAALLFAAALLIIAGRMHR